MFCLQLYYYRAKPKAHSLTVNREKSSFGEAIFPTLPSHTFPGLSLTHWCWPYGALHSGHATKPPSTHHYQLKHTLSLTCFLVLASGGRLNSLAELHRGFSGSLVWRARVMLVCVYGDGHWVCVDGCNYFSSVHDELSVSPTSRVSNINQWGGSAGSDLNTQRADSRPATVFHIHYLYTHQDMPDTHRTLSGSLSRWGGALCAWLH